ncbi:unnamed protein product [Blepharisma stoltei]|uniref:Uncharacterized protein n=1 Tax=Blepharisma stoltei TaxID=1481888 RepID=A0AAU9IZB1_9CILI|nr:unnamed protein product [Blepharisma stoltei]
MDSRYSNRGQDRYNPSQSTLQGFERQRGPDLSLQGQQIPPSDPYARPTSTKELFNPRSQDRYNPQSTFQNYDRQPRNDPNLQSQQIGYPDAYNRTGSSKEIKPPQNPPLQPSVRKAPPNDPKLEGFSATKTKKTTFIDKPQETGKPIEEEYIKNLQQQLYYLEMEIKLTKEQSKERAGKFMGGLEAGPLTENMVVLKSKYQKIQKDLEAKIDSLQNENRELMGRNQAFQTNLNRAIDDKSELQAKLREDTEHFDIDGEKYRKAITATIFQKEESAKKLGESTKERDLAKTYASETRIKLDRQATQIQALEDKVAQAEIFNNKLIEEKNKQLIELQDRLFKLEEDLKNQSTMTFLSDRLGYLNYQKQEVELERDNLLNKIKALKHTKQMIEKACRQAAADKRDLQNQVEDMKMDMEREKTQQEALLTKRLKEREKKELSIANQNVEDARRDSQYHMDNLKIKINENNELIEIKNQLTYDTAEIKGKSEVLEEDVKILKQKGMNLESDLKDTQFKIRVFEDRNKVLINDIEKDVRDSKHLAQENQELKAKIEFLTKKLDMNEMLKNIDLEELRALAKSNIQVNDTISQLISKWDNIQGERI